MRAIDNGNVEDAAQMVKLVDTPASGAGDRKVVEVRVFSWAPNSDQTRESGFFRFRGLKNLAWEVWPGNFPVDLTPRPHLRNFIVYPCNDLLHSSEENPG